MSAFIVPELSDLKNVLKGFDAQDIEDADYIRLLRYCRNDSINECFESWRVLAKDGLRASLLGGLNGIVRNDQDVCRSLREVPCWWTETGACARTRSTVPSPLLFDSSRGLARLAAGRLLASAECKKVLKQWKSRIKEIGQRRDPPKFGRS